MYQIKLLDSYKTAKNYVQDKQIAADLGIPQQRISEMRTGKRYLSDKEAIFLAEATNIDPHEVLIFLAADRAKDFKAQRIWQDITAKLRNQGFEGLVLGLTGIFALNTLITQCALHRVWLISV
ncbi:DUF3693 domain-containing protein [Photobacterium halotolerans]|uniref:Helix-turn-helix domain-containing protein n=1 Tax=Photobacterium halotolerans TaxID=265726 RepID=A0A7X4W972_9GAMM|nr:DUF3693 domain-containing protein [Photobacterium halotolerans]NAW64536.1 helix-turn-helix domain-containing protein [Photobacterium halotolerans]